MRKRRIARLLLLTPALLAVGPVQCINRQQVAKCENGCAERSAELLFLVATGSNDIDCWCSDWSAFPISRRNGEELNLDAVCEAWLEEQQDGVE